jgi:hypothetical protein
MTPATRHSMNPTPNAPNTDANIHHATFFVFDVESVGLHGEGFAVGGGVYLANGAAQWEFKLACPQNACSGSSEDRRWLAENVPVLDETHRAPKAMRDEFWRQWTKARSQGAVMAADCAWPVEAGFLIACIKDDPARKQEGPYPLHEIASYLASSGLNPIAKYDRTASELPQHDPLADARQSARLLALALARMATPKGLPRK